MLQKKNVFCEVHKLCSGLLWKVTVNNLSTHKSGTQVDKMKKFSLTILNF